MIGEIPADGLWPVVAVPAIAGLALLAGAMSRGGAVGGAVVGLLVALGAGWAGLAMLATLLLVGTWSTARDRRGRSALQAICNGGVAAAAAVAAGLGAAWGGAALAGALATALSDTVAGEWGQRRHGVARILLFGPVVPAGTDGGMSLVGTGAAVAGALLVPLAGVAVAGDWDPRWVGLVALAGFLGQVADSVIGVCLQPRLGRRGNDWTNLLATACGALIAVALV